MRYDEGPVGRGREGLDVGRFSPGLGSCGQPKDDLGRGPSRSVALGRICRWAGKPTGRRSRPKPRSCTGGWCCSPWTNAPNKPRDAASTLLSLRSSKLQVCARAWPTSTCSTAWLSCIVRSLILRGGGHRCRRFGPSAKRGFWTTPSTCSTPLFPPLGELKTRGVVPMGASWHAEMW